MINNMSYNIEKEKKSNKVNVLAALIITMAVIIIAISGSYAYFLSTIQKENEENAAVTIKSGKLVMNFTTTNYINGTNVKPVDIVPDATDISPGNIKITESTLTGASVKYTDFTIKFVNDNTVPKAQYEIFLTNVKLTDNFMNKYVKWVLYKGSVQVAQGDFSTAQKVASAQKGSDNTYDMEDISLFTAPVQITSSETNGHAYKFYMWLENDNGVNQSNDCTGGTGKTLNTDCFNLREGKVSGKLAFRAISVGN